ncbi:MAG: DNA mismatch repair endonuclease MutL, partial [Planctomycetota bacterium]
GEYLFLNGRWIQDRTLQHALTEAYRGLLMVGRYPITFLFLEMPPEEVDVNVHPTKAEVRFQDSQQLFRLLLSALRTRFLGMNLESQIKVPSAAAEAKAQPVPEPQRPLPLREELNSWATAQFPGTPAASGNDQPADRTPPSFPAAVSRTLDAPFKPFPEGGGQPFYRPTAANWSSPAPTVSGDETPENSTQTTASGTAPAAAAWTMDSSPAPVLAATPPLPVSDSSPAQPDAAAAPAGLQPAFRAMQMHDCYLVVESEEGLTVIDQHALHERIMYEHLRERVLAGNVESQRLLLPEAIDLSPPEASVLLEYSETLAQIGLEISDFGGHTVLLSRYPVMLRKLNLSGLVKDIAQTLCESGLAPTRRDILDELLNMMACKAAIKAGQRLSSEEIDSLLAQRHLIDDAHHCPHGRPTSLTLTRTELDRQFGRLG